MSAKRPGSEQLLQAPPLKQSKSDPSEIGNAGYICIVCDAQCHEKQKHLDDEKWENFRLAAKKWSGLDTYGDVFIKTDWKSGWEGKFWHKMCKLNISTEKKLKQALKRKEAAKSPDEKSDDAVNEDERPATRKSVGIIHDKSACIWCTRGYDERHPDRSEKLSTIETRTTWQKIVLSTPYLKDKAMQIRVEMLINSTTDPLAAKIAYHKGCYRDYVIRGLEECEQDEGINGKIHITEVRKLFLDGLELKSFFP